MWTDWLISGPTRDPEWVRRLQTWLEQQFADNVSHKVLTERLLTATGTVADNPAVVYALTHLGTHLPAKERADQGQFDAVPLTWHAGRLFEAARSGAGSVAY